MSGKVIKFKLIAAVCDNMGIGNKGGIPWRLKKEMEYFAKMTTMTKDNRKKNVVVMGRKTWESVPSKYKPLPNRVNVIISNTIKMPGLENVLVFRSLDEALTRLNESPLSEIIEDIWIIGGSSLYEEAINSPLCDAVYLTRVQGEFECDTFFPKIPEYYKETREETVPSEIQQEKGLCYRFTVLKRLQENV